MCRPHAWCWCCSHKANHVHSKRARQDLKATTLTMLHVVPITMMLVWLQTVVCVASTVVCPSSRMVVVNDPAQQYYSWKQCSDPRNGGKGYTTEPINEAKHAGSVTLLSIARCNLKCLGPRAFNFTGASHVTEVNIGNNAFAALPPDLLWNMPSLLHFKAEALTHLQNLPERLFVGQNRLTSITFASSTNLGAQTRLPDGLFKGLTSLVGLDLQNCNYRNLPDLGDLTALTHLYAWMYRGRGQLHMSDQESESKFDNLVAVGTLALELRSLTRVPSVKNARSLTSLWLAANKISRIFPGDFAGATRLVMLSLGNNCIVSVATEAFANLVAFQVKPDDFRPTKADGTAWHDSFGIGLWPHKSTAGLSYFGSNEDWANAPIGFAPNPVECLWVGPHVSDLNCSGCVLGHETTSASNNTCVKPEFRPYKGWAMSAHQTELRIQDAQGLVAEYKAGTNTTILSTQHMYTIKPPMLEPKDRMFSGYEQPHTKMHYELDFSRGAKVDIGCGTEVVGDGTDDQIIPKSVFAHPSSMHEMSYQWLEGRANLNATPPDVGYYPQKCPRYHRFHVTKHGNFTFDACSSMMMPGINIYKRTDNLSESEPRMTSGSGGFKRGQFFEVPLHENNQQYGTCRTGLIRVQPDILGETLVGWINQFKDPDYPELRYPDHATFNSVNGCPLSQSANRTYFLQSGSYILETLGSFLRCSHFNVKMTCSGGAESASPSDSDPLGFSVNAKTGGITGTPRRVRDGYRMRLRAVDAAEVRTTVAEWIFNVVKPPAFRVNPSAAWAMESDGKLAGKYHVNETHLLPKPRLERHVLLERPSGGDFTKVIYLLSAEPVIGNPNCNATKRISALTDVATGEGAINVQCEGTYTANLAVRDGAGAELTLRSWTFQVLRRDTDVSAYGPGGRECTNGDPTDGEEMDRKFTCDCGATQFSGDNCDIGQDTKTATNGPNGQGCGGGIPVDTVPFDQAFVCNCNATKFTGANCDVAANTVYLDNTTVYVIIAVMAVLALGVVVVLLLLRYQPQTS